MDEMFPDLIRDAASRVETAYARRLLAAMEQGGGDNLFSSLRTLLRCGFADLLCIPDFAGEAFALCMLALALKLFGNALRRERLSRAVDCVVGLLLASIVVGAAFEILTDCALYMRDIALFFGALAPILGILTASGGNLTAAGSASMALSVFLSFAEWLVTRFAPLATAAFLGTAVAGACDGSSVLLSLAKGARNVLFGFFSLVTSLFFILVGCQNVAAVQADTVSAKAFRLLIANAVPIVGSTIGDALKLVGGSLVTVKNAVGICAVLFLVTMFFPVLLRLWLWRILLSLFGFLCECAALPTAKNMFAQVKCAFDFSLAANTSVVVMGFLNIGIFMANLPTVAA